VATNLTLGGVPCPSCGARLGGLAGCRSAFDELSAQAWTNPNRGAVHNLFVDTYSMQHPEEFCRSPKSYAQHLTALCCGLEHPAEVKLYWSIPRWLDGPAVLDRPAPPLAGRRGAMTVADLLSTPNGAAYRDLVQRWARDVWGAYAGQHDLAHQWLASVRQHMIKTLGRSVR